MRNISYGCYICHDCLRNLAFFFCVASNIKNDRHATSSKFSPITNHNQQNKCINGRFKNGLKTTTK